MGKMRPTAEILPVPVPVHADRLVTGDRFDQFNLVGLVGVLVVLDSPGAFPDLGAHGVTRGDDLAHLFFDGGKVLVGERLGPIKVIVPALVDHRADGDLHVRPDLLDSACHDVCAVVPYQLQHRVGLVIRLRSDDRQTGIRIDWDTQIRQSSIDPTCQCCLAQ